MPSKVMFRVKYVELLIFGVQNFLESGMNGPPGVMYDNGEAFLVVF